MIFDVSGAISLEFTEQFAEIASELAEQFAEILRILAAIFLVKKNGSGIYLQSAGETRIVILRSWHIILLGLRVFPRGPPAFPSPLWYGGGSCGWPA